MKRPLFSAVALVVLAGCAVDDGSIPFDASRRVDARGADGAALDPDGAVAPEASVIVCTDMDNDGISDGIETAQDDDGDGTPNNADDDSDGDGFSDHDEAVGNYPTRMNADTLACGIGPADCDMDGIANYRDRDSDNDGLTDAEERMANTDVCGEDTDGDGVTDLVERVAMSDPASPRSMPPAGSLYVTLPYHPPDGPMGPLVQRRFPFATQIRAADIFFLVDTTGSMGPTIMNVQNTLMSRIIPGIRAALGPMGDARYGVAGHGDFGEGDTPAVPRSQNNLTVFQRLTTDAMAAQNATMSLTAFGGADEPESMVPAMHSLMTGFGTPNYRGTAVRMVDPARDCGAMPDQPQPYGWGCFLPGRVPIVVLFSDADWHNKAGTPNFYTSTPNAGTYEQLRMAMVDRGAYFVGIDVSARSMNTYINSTRLARDTNTLDGMRAPIAFRGSADSVAQNVINGITTIVGTSRQDVTTRTDPDTMERRLPTGRTTANFLRAVRPHSAMPEMPEGYDRKDATTFYNVNPRATVTFEVDFYNDFLPGTSVAQLFRATIVVLGRARSELDRREVFIIVPAGGSQPPPG